MFHVSSSHSSSNPSAPSVHRPCFSCMSDCFPVQADDIILRKIIHQEEERKYQFLLRQVLNQKNVFFQSLLPPWQSDILATIQHFCHIFFLNTEYKLLSIKMCILSYANMCAQKTYSELLFIYACHRQYSAVLLFLCLIIVLCITYANRFKK